jgi:small subunit ribosomal protein S20
MPITISAKKKLRQDKKQTFFNQRTKKAFVETVKKTRRNPTVKNLTAAFSTIDTAVKKHLLHKNTGARLKSRLSLRLKNAAQNPKSPKT